MNIICARPVLVTWFFGSVIINILVLVLGLGDFSLQYLFKDEGIFYILLLVVANIMLGYFLGMLTIWPFIRKICSWYNGAPLKVGDKVKVLTGPLRGKIAIVYSIPLGQGGWSLACIELGHEQKEQFTDIFEQYSLLKLTEKT